MKKSIIILFILTALVNGQSVYSPMKPKWRDSLTISYKPIEEKWEKENLYFVIYLFYENDKRNEFNLHVQKKDSLFTSRFYIEDSTSFIKIFFTNGNDVDSKSTIKSLIYNLDGQVARNGFNELALDYHGVERDSILKEELKLYPDNYKVYQSIWSNLKMKYQHWEYSLKDTILNDLKKIEKKKGNINPGLFYLYSHANLILGNENKFHYYLNELQKSFPISPITTYSMWVFNSINEAKLKSNIISGIAKNKESFKFKYSYSEINESWQIRVLNEFHDSKVARGLVKNNIQNEEVKPAIIEKILRNWIKEDENNPKPYLYLSMFYFYRMKNLDEAYKNLQNAKTLLNTVNKSYHFSVYFKNYAKEFEKSLNNLQADIERRRIFAQ